MGVPISLRSASFCQNCLYNVHSVVGSFPIERFISIICRILRRTLVLYAHMRPIALMKRSFPVDADHDLLCAAAHVEATFPPRVVHLQGLRPERLAATLGRQYRPRLGQTRSARLTRAVAGTRRVRLRHDRRFVERALHVQEFARNLSASRGGLAEAGP